MEKLPVPQADRVVGSPDIAPELAKRFLGYELLDEDGKPVTATKEILTKIFDEVAADKKLFEGLELEKTEKDLYIVHIATEAVRKFATDLGREVFVDLPIDNIHFLTEGGVSKYTKGRLSTGSHATVLGQVLVDRRSDLQTAITVFHELWHTLGSHEVIQVTTDGMLDWYRAGFSIKSRSGEKEYFYRIDEGLTGLMTKRFVEEILVSDPLFAEEIERMKVSEQDIDTTRRGELKMLREVSEIIYQKNKEDFDSPDDVINLFLEGQVTGNILPIARLVEKTFGKGSFRKFGENTQT